MNEYAGNTIVEEIVRGDRDAFRVLVFRYKSRAISVAYSFCGNYEDAKDLSQEAFLKAFRTIKCFRGGSKFYTWFYRILVNICKDHLRRRKRNKIISFSVRFKGGDPQAGTEDIFESIASKEPGPGQVLLNRELGARLTKAIRTLPEKQRTVFVLKNIHGFTIAEIAEIIRCATGTVKAHLFKATGNLRKRLEPLGGKNEKL